MKTNPLVKFYNRFETSLKYPYLEAGSIGIQVGFDLSSKNLTSDLFNMSDRVGEKGLVIGIDPDNANHKRAQKVIEENGIINIQLVKIGTYKEKTTLEFHLANRSSNNYLMVYEPEDRHYKTGNILKVDVDTFDSIVALLNIDIDRVRHVNVTNNGAEYHTLVGMREFLSKAKNISVSLTCGRVGVMGLVDDKPDQDLILEEFKNQGFKSKFYRIKDLFWWGFYKKLLIKRKWMYSGKPHFGVVLAHKGNQPIKLHHSYM
jgi:FkbM family methyltransferase